MVIKRKYATYSQLMADNSSKDVIYRAMHNFNITDDKIEELLEGDANLIALNTDLGSGIPGEAFLSIMSEFDTLDKEKPLDNGMTYRDVTGVITYSSRRGKAIMQVMYNHIMDLPPLIVQVIAFECEDGKITQVEPWDVGNIIL